VGNRIYSTLQYPNTTATFLALAAFLGLALLNLSQTRLGKIIYSVGNILLVAVIVASQSRGSWALYPVVMLVFFLGMPSRYRFATLFNLVLAWGVGLQIARVLQPSMLSGTGAGTLKYILIGAIVVIVGQWVYDLVINWLDSREVRDSTRRLLGAGVIVYALIVALVYIVYTAQAVPSVAAQFAPTNALQRAGTINNQDVSFTSRLDFNKAAVQMALDYPINGLGGEGWNALYHRYPPYLVFTSETHNYPAKVLVETGITGLAVLLVIWMGWLRSIYRLWRTRIADVSWLLILAGGAAAINLGIHSIYDFDLSMGAMGILLWCLWGTIRGAAELYFPAERALSPAWRKLLALTLAGSLGAVILGGSAASLYAAGLKGAEGAKAMTERNWVEAERKLLKATKLDPFSASYAADLAQVYTIKGMASNDKEQIALAEQYTRQAVAMEPYNYPIRQRLLTVSLLSGRVEQAVESAESLVAHNPLDVHNFEILGKLYIAAGRYLHESGQKDQAKQYWRKTGELNRQLAAKLKDVKADYRRWDGDPLQVTPVVKLYEGEAAYLLGDYRKASQLLQEALRSEGSLPEELRIEAQLYWSAARAKQGKALEAQQEISRLANSFPLLPAEFQKIMQINP
jgi:tetratricopeptide (TPR) repeat protein